MISTYRIFVGCNLNTEKIRRWCDKDSTVIRMRIYVKQRERMHANTQIKFKTTIIDTHTYRTIFLSKIRTNT